ncbi:MAG: hypothetical protein ACI8UO_006646 [Verrucomicrobiales bacterium]|jgi:hypothetical protein
MKKLLSILVLAGLAHSAIAGEAAPALADYSKNPISKQPVIEDTGCACFDGTIEFSGFVAGIFPQGNAHDDAIGGGISAAYFFNPNLGTNLSAAWFGTDSEIHNYTADLILRFPNRFSCFAPYILGGGGLHTNGDTVGIYRLGAGVDLRFEDWNCGGIFADGVYTWSAGDVENYTIGRLGVRIPF